VSAERPTEDAASASSANGSIRATTAAAQLAPWLLILTLDVVAWAWAEQVGLLFTGWLTVAIGASVLGVIGLFYEMTGRSESIADAARYLGLWVAFSVTGAVFTYLAAALRMPLYDTAFTAMDAALGFDWPSWSSFVDAHHLLKIPLTGAYVSLWPQTVGSILYFAYTGRRDRNADLFWTAMVSLAITTLVWAMFPALGPFVHVWHREPDYARAVLALRDGTVSSFSLQTIEGVVVMPSFHTALGVAYVYAHRPPARSFILAGFLNVLMILSIPSEGGHYLVDVIGGFAVAILSILLLKRDLKRVLR
jgi:membrane-associated phospholipid phosphatase